MALILGAFAGIITRTRFDLALTGIIISTGINYGFSFVFIAISASILYFLLQSENIIAIALLAATMQIVSLVFLFRIKRFKRGILFLQKRGAGAIGLIISGIILLAVTLMANSEISNEAMALPIFGGIFCVVGLMFWWRRGLTKFYREKIKERNMREYEAIIAEKDGHIQTLQESNEFMAKLIHRDNKLLSAMREAMLLSLESGSIEESKRILNQIEALMQERTGVITQNQRENKVLPTTGDALLDGVMNHMLLRASEKDIQFDLAVVGSISELTNAIIPVIKLETLCADLIENAIIAASHNEYKRILIALGRNEGFYEINIQDSGIPFESTTLLNLGTIKASTHLDDGGSGIGYITIFEILHEYSASLIITEYEPKSYGFSKSVCVRFNDKNEFILQTYRAEDFLPLLPPKGGPTISPIILIDH